MVPKAMKPCIAPSLSTRDDWEYGFTNKKLLLQRKVSSASLKILNKVHRCGSKISLHKMLGVVLSTCITIFIILQLL